MPRYKVIVEYDGSSYSGWQFQKNAPSVQASIEAAIEEFCGERVRIQGAGRTDAGVHALGQVAHFDIASERDPGTVRDAINAHLRPQPVAVIVAERVPSEFDARHSARKRHYFYRIVNRRPDLTLNRGRAWRVPKPLDASAMHRAAQILVGRHDFSTFRSTECQSRSPLKTIDRLDVERVENEVHFRTEARSFLHNQVRSMVGSLVLVGDGSWSDDDLRGALESRNRASCGPVAPPEGLYLVRVDY